MPKGISLSPTIETFALSLDASGDTTVQIRQARSGDMLRISEMYSKRTRVWDFAPGEDEARHIKLENEYNEAKVKRLMAYLTLAGCNIVNLDKDEPLFKFKNDQYGVPHVDMTEDAFNRLWDALPADLTEEIVNCIFEVNPQWGPQGE